MSKINNEAMMSEILERQLERERRANNAALKSQKFYMWDLKKRIWDTMMAAGMIELDGTTDIDSMIGIN